MNKVLWTLIKINLKSIFAPNLGAATKQKKKNPSKIKGAGKVVLIAILVLYCLAVFCGMFGMIFYSIGEIAIQNNMNWFFFTMMFILSFGISFIGSVMGTQRQIYDVKDNELLLSMPIKSSHIVFARVFALIILSVGYQSVVMLPCAVVYGILGGFTFASVIGFIVIFVTVPLLSMALSCIIGFVIAFITSKMKRKNLFTSVLSISFFAIYFAFYMNIEKYINELLTNGEQIATAIKKGFYPAYAIGIAGEGDFLMMLIVLLISTALFGAIYALISKTFVNIAKMNKTKNKIEYKAKALKTSGVKTALLKNEFYHFASNPMYILNTEMGAILSLVMAVMLFVKRETLLQMAQADIIIPQIICIGGAVLLVASNYMSASSINVEFKNLWLLKSLPIKANDVLIPKVLSHFIISEAGVFIFGIAACIAVPFDFLFMAMLFIVPTIVNLFIAITGLLINIAKPRFNWTNEIFAAKQSISVFFSMLVGFSLSAVFVLIYLFLLAPSGFSINAYSAIFSAVLLIVSLAFYRIIISEKVQKKFITFGE